MYDFVKIHVKNICIQSIKQNMFLEFHSKLNHKTGEVKENELIAEFDGLEFTIKNNQHLFFNGSVHKFWNQTNTNYNDYTINDFKQTAEVLDEKFDLNAFSCLLHNLEFGVNINLPFETETFLNAIISFKGKEYELDTFNGFGKLLRFRFNRYYELKIYNKGMQYNLNDNILRFEIKVKKMHYFKSKKINIQTLADLLNLDVIEDLKKQLIKTFKELLIYDESINLKEVNRRSDRELLINGRNPKYWQNLSNLNPNTYKKKRKRFRELISIYGKSNIQKNVLDLIEQKLEKITKDQPIVKSVPDLTTLLISPYSECTRFNTSSIWLNKYPFVFGRLTPNPV